MRITAMMLVVAGLLAFAGCGSHHTHYHTDSPPATTMATACPTCTHVTPTSTFWCDNCNHGYVHGRVVACRSCYSAMNGGPVCVVHR